MIQSIPIIGHARKREQLRRDVEQKSLAHAYLFAGKKHLGKFTIARWFAEEVLSIGVEEGEKERIVTLVRKNAHPDLLTLDQLWIEDLCTDWNVIAKSSSAPQQHRAKAKVKTDVIGIDDIRALQERLYQTPQGSRSICLIRSIERLHITAANALLKILEEPPPNVLFCFTTELLSAIPETVVSRMRLLHFSGVLREELEPLLSDSSPEDRELILGIAGGAPGIIFRCLKDTEYFRTERQAYLDARRFLETRSDVERFRIMSEVFEDPAASSLLFRHLVLHLQGELRKESQHAEEAVERAKKLFSILRTLETNTHRGLLAANIALSS